MATQTRTGLITPVSGIQTPQTPSEPPAMMDSYTFPIHKLKRRQSQPGKTPLVLVACGSFSRESGLILYFMDTIRILTFSPSHHLPAPAHV